MGWTRSNPDAASRTRSSCGSTCARFTTSPSVCHGTSACVGCPAEPGEVGTGRT
jgi:hypothetical protein